MAKGPPAQRNGAPSGRFWGNVVLIALAHVALIAGLIHWSVAARASSNPESIVWLGGAGDLSAGELEKQESPSPKQPSLGTEPSGSEQDEVADEKPVVTTAKSEIELPSATPKPTATTTPAKPSVTPALRAKTTPKPIPKPTPKKTVVAKASAKPATKPKPTPAKASAKSEKKDKITLAKRDSASQSGSGQSGSTGKAGSEGGGSSGAEFGWYGNMLHDRFYSAWIQPTTNVPSGAKISTLVKVRIEKDGRVSKFEIAKPSENATVNESVAAVAKQVSQVDPPPTGLIKGDHYDVKINFELNTEEKPEK
ncbi:MAG TPA: TonB family protein [Candidatus Udaeobacter sp.]|nr:TonB family protein [Candidatus Udaeobacter sp.]